MERPDISVAVIIARELRTLADEVDSGNVMADAIVVVTGGVGAPTMVHALGGIKMNEALGMLAAGQFVLCKTTMPGEAFGG